MTKRSFIVASRVAWSSSISTDADESVMDAPNPSIVW